MLTALLRGISVFYFSFALIPDRFSGSNLLPLQ